MVSVVLLVFYTAGITHFLFWTLIFYPGTLNCRFLALPHPGLALYRNCIELESNLAFTGDKTGLTNARRLYESALATYDQDSSLWHDYHSLEIKVKKPQSLCISTYMQQNDLHLFATFSSKLLYNYINLDFPDWNIGNCCRCSLARQKNPQEYKIMMDHCC